MSDRQTFNYGTIQDQLLRSFNDALKVRVSRDFDRLIDELTSSQVLKSSALPLGDQYAVRGVLMRGIIENAFLQQVSLPKTAVREWAEGRYEALRSLPKYGGRDAVKEKVAQSVATGDVARLYDSLVITWDTRDFQRRLELQAGVTLKNRIGNRFSDTLVYQLRLGAEASLKVALQTTGLDIGGRIASLSAEEVELLEEDVRRSISFLDTTGAIRFHVSGNRVSFRRDDLAPKSIEYRALLNHTIKRIKDSDLLRRLDNKDRQVASYMEEYFGVLEGGERLGFAITLSAVAACLTRQLTYNQSSAPLDERIDEPSIIMLEDFIQANNLFVQSFESIEEALRDKQRALDLSRKLVETSNELPWNALRRIASTESIFEEQSRAALQKLGDALPDEMAEQNSYLVVIGMGALRGSLRSMAGTVLDAQISGDGTKARKAENRKGDLISEFAKEGAKEIVKEFVKQGFKDDGLYHRLTYFFVESCGWLVNLAQAIPTYFGWITPFISYVKARVFGGSP